MAEMKPNGKMQREIAESSNEIRRLAENAKKEGILKWFAGNHVAVNLLMCFLLFAGAATLKFIKVEVFPDVTVDMITVSMTYLGATPAEVEEAVCQRIEESISGVEGIKEIRSTSSEGMGVVVAELEEYVDQQKVLDDIKMEVDRIETFPAETEKPIYTIATARHLVKTLMLYGDVPERSLKELAERIRDDLTAKDMISQVSVSGTREYEISIEVSEQQLRKYNLRFEDVSAVVSRSSLDLPAGSIKTRGGEILLRTKGQRYQGTEFEDIVVKRSADGTEVHLGDIATVIDGFEDSDVLVRLNGKRAVQLNISRVGNQNALDISNEIKAYLEELRPQLPAGIDITTGEDMSEILRDRIDLLTRNGYLGLALVFISLLLFLDIRLAFWTAMGIPISFFGSFVILNWLGISINMMSLFAYIVVLGIVVDDAIVVGENIFSYRQMGYPGWQAAVMGVKEMASPVVLAVLTTIAAFAPLLFTKGMMGKFLGVLPIVVISVLGISLVECLLILPAHLSGKWKKRKEWFLPRGQRYVREGLEWFIQRPFAWFLDYLLKWRYVTVSLAIMLMLVMLGIYQGGLIKFTFMPTVEADNMVALLEMPQGTPVEQTARLVAYIESKAQEVRDEYDADSVEDESIFVQVTTSIGQQPSTGGGGPGGRSSGASGSNLGEVNVELLNSEKRLVRSEVLKNLWREKVGEIPGVSSLTYQANLFSLGDAVSVRLSHYDFDTLLDAAERLKERLSEFAGVNEITDSFEPGKEEMKIKLTQQGRQLGLTLDDLARQVRAAFYGQESQRIQRGRDDVRVMVRYPEDQRESLTDIQTMRIRLADGAEIPFEKVAHVEMGRSYASIDRVNRRRIVTVMADVDEEVTNAEDINKTLVATVLPQLKDDYPGLSYDFSGRQKERNESMQSMMLNFIVALVLIYGLLAIQFRSYIQPALIMTAIPFGMIGALIGHMLMGFHLSLLSVFGIVALTGVVVNDSLIMIDLINRERREGQWSLHDIVLHSATRRFRPILLTTMTTFLGLMPMLLEKSLQAQFLIPMAVSLGFGVLFATTITLILIPCLYMILEDVKLGAYWCWGVTPKPEQSNPAGGDASEVR